MRIDARMFAFVPGGVRMAVGNLPPVKRFIGMMLRDLKIPKEVLKFITHPTRFDNRETERALKGSGIKCRRWIPTPGGCGTTGSATSTRICTSTARSRARWPAKWC
ncbi:hypothetical protein [Thermomonas sp.]|uniref:hypothetical protein n=1 Tax=Thermomonas sp. TaxID=1971895 RepID=UPI0026052EBF|nr:hypothetical protein [Thermomonas sp.]